MAAGNSKFEAILEAKPKKNFGSAGDLACYIGGSIATCEPKSEAIGGSQGPEFSAGLRPGEAKFSAGLRPGRRYSHIGPAVDDAR